MHALLSRLARLVVLLVMASGLSLALASSASAADGCGSGWHKQSDGGFGGSKSAAYNGRTITSAVSGSVRYCTRERSLKPDQKNQRVLIGIPSTLVGTGKVVGRHARLCATQTTTISISPWVSSGSIGVSGTTPGGSVNVSNSKVTHSISSCVGSGYSRIAFPQNTLKVTAPNGVCEYYAGAWTAACFAGPFVTKVTSTVATKLTYYVNGTQKNPVVYYTETDYS